MKVILYSMVFVIGTLISCQAHTEQIEKLPVNSDSTLNKDHTDVSLPDTVGLLSPESDTH